MKSLLPLKMMGQGTADIESLTSYLLRSAFEHGVSVGLLLRHIDNVIENGPGHIDTNLRGQAGATTLSRANSLEKKIRNGLKELTGQNMACEPLRFLEGKLSRISGDIGGIRWCPECLLEMKEIGSPIFIKQLWHMRAVTRCPIHRVRLQGECEWCGSEQNSMMARRPLGFCMECGHALYERKTALSPHDISNSWMCESFDVVDVFEKTAKSGDVSGGKFRSDYFSLHFPYRNEYKSFYWLKDKQIQEVAASCGLKWEQGFKLISVRRLAYKLNISLYELLNYTGHVHSLPLISMNKGELPRHLKIRRRVYRDHARIYKSIKSYLKRQIDPPSLKRLAREVGVSVGYIEYRYPVIVKMISERYSAHLRARKASNKYKALSLAFQFFHSDKYAAYNRSRKEAYRILKRESGLPKWVLKEAIQTAYAM